MDEFTCDQCRSIVSKLYDGVCGDCFNERDYDDDRYEDEGDWCYYCGGEGWGIVGCDWDSHDPINGPYPGEVEKCPCCNGSGDAKDCTFW